MAIWKMIKIDRNFKYLVTGIKNCLKAQILQMRYQNVGSNFTVERKKSEIFNLS